MPASVEPRRSLPAVVVNRSRKVEPCSLFWDAGGELLQFGDSKLSWSFSSFECFPEGHSLFSKIKIIIANLHCCYHDAHTEQYQYPAFPSGGHRLCSTSASFTWEHTRGWTTSFKTQTLWPSKGLPQHPTHAAESPSQVRDAVAGNTPTAHMHSTGGSSGDRFWCHQGKALQFQGRNQ